MFNDRKQCALCLKEFGEDERQVYIRFNEAGEIDVWPFKKEEASKIFDFSEGELKFLKRHGQHRSLKCCRDRAACRENFEKAITPKDRQFKKNAVRKENGVLTYFNIHPRFAKSLYSVDEKDVVEVLFEVQEGPGTEEDYWGWYDIEDQNFYHIWKDRRSLNICFSSGIEAAEDNRKGKAYALKVISVSDGK